MGNYFSKWKSTSVTDELVKLDQEITYYEEQKQSSVKRQKQVVGSLLFYSVLLYLVAVPLLYMYYLPSDFQGKFKRGWPILVFPFVVFVLKKLFHWYFVKQVLNSDIKLERLRERKNKMLEDVMENETYKKAREILSRFDPDRLQVMQDRVSGSPQNSPRSGGTPADLRYRGTGPGVNTPMTRGVEPTPQGAPVTSPPPNLQATPITTSAQTPSQNRGPRNANFSPRPLPMPRPILPRDRSVIDRMVDLLTADGPSNRFALICSQCLSHNGMALQEEFEYIAFRCCYCYHVNPARRQRPTAPQLVHINPASPAISSPARPREKRKEERGEEASEDIKSEDVQAAAAEGKSVETDGLTGSQDENKKKDV